MCCKNAKSSRKKISYTRMIYTSFLTRLGIQRLPQWLIYRILTNTWRLSKCLVLLFLYKVKEITTKKYPKWWSIIHRWSPRQIVKGQTFSFLHTYYKMRIHLISECKNNNIIINLISIFCIYFHIHFFFYTHYKGWYE
jgi:hypothetical protein